MDIKQIIQPISELPEGSLSKLLNIITEVEFPKGYLLLESDRLERNTYFIKRGLVRAFQYKEGNDVTFWFGQEGDLVLSMRSYVENKPGYENIELLEKTVLYKLNNSNLQQLYSQDISIANWGRKLAEKELIKTEENFVARQFKTALERYCSLIEKNPELLNRVQLGHIASYLGITQVTLSRIRADI